MAQKPAVEPQTELTLTEALNSLNGVEYDNANRLSKGRLIKLIDEDPVEGAFVLVTILRQREDKALTFMDVKKVMTLGEINTYFTPEPEDTDEDDPESEVGKD